MTYARAGHTPLIYVPGVGAGRATCAFWRRTAWSSA